MSDERRTFNPMTALLAVLVVAVAVLVYMVFETRGQLVALAATHGGTVSQVTDLQDSDPTAIQPSNGATAPSDPFTAMNRPFVPNAWNPFQEMDAMNRQIDALFNQAFSRFGEAHQFGGMMQGDFTPRMDLKDEGDHYVAHLDIPGAEEPSINVSVKNDTLTVDARTDFTTKNNGQNGQVLHQERRMGSFMRSIPLPEPVDLDSLKTSYEDGVLTVTINKASSSN